MAEPELKEVPKMKTDSSVGRFVGMLHRYSRMHFAEAVKPFGIPESTFPFLMKLFRQDDASQDDLARFHHKDKATVARGLAKLEKAGFITRRTDPDDRRVKRVRLTAKAKHMEPKLRVVLAAWSETLTAGFSEQEREMALTLLERMAENARRAVEAPCP